MARSPDRRLGMDRPIDRRDFLNGVAIAVGAIGTGATPSAVLAESLAWPQDRPGYNPPALTGLRGSHPGSFEAAHALRDGDIQPDSTAVHDTTERYDLVIVGAGLSGLSAAWFWSQARPADRILILDNHDDFGGHAKRNEFQLGGKLHVLNGGTLGIDSPRPYSAAADGLLQSLGIRPEALSARCDRNEVYSALGLRRAAFFDRETFGQDRLVAGSPSMEAEVPAAERPPADLAAWRRWLNATPLSQRGRDDLLRIAAGACAPLPDAADDAARKDRLSRMSYKAFLVTALGAGPEALAFLQPIPNGEWGVGIDAISALDAWGFGYPGFDALKLSPKAAPRMGFTPEGYVEGGSYTFHFPDGNASIARALVARLSPGAFEDSAVEQIVGARPNYAALDGKGSRVRIRLSSIVVRARHQGGTGSDGVEVVYQRGGRLERVVGRRCVLAGYNMMIPYLCPELPEDQKSALKALVKTPLVYTSVALRQWTAFHRLGVRGIYAPGSYFTQISLNEPVDIGRVTAERDPARPILIRMSREPCSPGLSEFDQNRTGRAELLATSFETFERNIRLQLNRMLGPGGFDAARDILAVTVNRWPHGYAPEHNPLFDPDVPKDQRANVMGRKRFGRIAIANSDSGGGAYTDVAIDQARRAVDELLALDA